MRWRRGLYIPAPVKPIDQRGIGAVWTAHKRGRSLPAPPGVLTEGRVERPCDEAGRDEGKRSLVASVPHVRRLPEPVNRLGGRLLKTEREEIDKAKIYPQWVADRWRFPDWVAGIGMGLFPAPVQPIDKWQRSAVIAAQTVPPEPSVRRLWRLYFPSGITPELIERQSAGVAYF